MTEDELKEYLDFKAEEYNSPNFIQTDPIQIPHHYSRKEDIEIIAFLVATIAWGNRKMIIRNGERLMNILGESPHDFLVSANKDHLKKLEFTHRTFNSEDLQNFLLSLKHIYSNEKSLENLFESDSHTMKSKISLFRRNFISEFRSDRTLKHVANPESGSAAKRINMFLRWMVRKDKNGVDFGIWNSISSSELHLPLDVHSGKIARKLGLLKRKQNDWKAVEELQSKLIKFDSEDPCKYDFALFGIGAFEDL